MKKFTLFSWYFILFAPSSPDTKLLFCMFLIGSNPIFEIEYVNKKIFYEALFVLLSPSWSNFFLS